MLLGQPVSTAPNIQDRRVADVVFARDGSGVDDRLAPFTNRLELLRGENGPIALGCAFLPVDSCAREFDARIGHAEGARQVYELDVRGGLLREDVADLLRGQLARFVGKVKSGVLFLGYPTKIVGAVVSRVAVLVVAYVQPGRRSAMKSLRDETMKRHAYFAITPCGSAGRDFFSLKQHFAVLADF